MDLQGKKKLKYEIKSLCDFTKISIGSISNLTVFYLLFNCLQTAVYSFGPVAFALEVILHPNKSSDPYICITFVHVIITQQKRI